MVIWATDKQNRKSFEHAFLVYYCGILTILNMLQHPNST